MIEKKWNLIPKKQIGPLLFGCSKKEVHKILGKKYKPFRKTIFAKSTTDAYDNYHIYYDKFGNFEAIEIFEGITVLMNGMQLFPGTMIDTMKWVNDLEKDGDGGISKKLSIGLYAPNDEEMLESILVGKEGYYKDF